MKKTIITLVALTAINASAALTTVTVCTGGESGTECSQVTYNVRDGAMAQAADQHLNAESEVQPAKAYSNKILLKINALGSAIFGADAQAPAFPGYEAP